MSNAPESFVYNAELTKIIDGDTLRCNLDLGFSVKLHNQTVRLAGIDTPESRINIKRYPHRADEKVLGLKAKERLKMPVFVLDYNSLFIFSNSATALVEVDIQSYCEKTTPAHTVISWLDDYLLWCLS